MSYSQAWLDSDSAVRSVLVEIEAYDMVGATTVYFYLSNTGYMSADASVFFAPDLTGSVTINETLSTNGASVSYGSIDVHNTNGERDAWLDNEKYVWAGRSIKIYHGDNTWVCQDLATIKSTFQLVFDGNIHDITSVDISSVKFAIVDKMERLNTPISEDKIGTTGVWPGGQQNEDQLVPIVLGEVFNIEPVLIDPATLTYKFNNGPSERLIEIRDNGAPIYNTTITGGATVDLNASTFTLLKPLAGVVTVSVQGIKKSFNNAFDTYSGTTYRNSVVDAIAVLVTQYGDVAQRLTLSELDSVNLAAFYTNNNKAVGDYISDRRNIVAACKELANSVRGSLFFNRLGKLQLLKLGEYTTDTPVTITKSDIILNTFSPKGRATVESRIRLGYAKNWTVQQELVTAIPAAHKEWFGTEWKTVSAEDTITKSLYKQFGDPVQQDTLLITDVDAAAEANSRLNYDMEPHITYGFIGTTRLLSLKLGQEVTIVYDRYGLDAGVSAQVTALRPNWTNNSIEVEITV